jgi:hypothetical protein
MNAAFQVHLLNDQGKAKATKIAEAFHELVEKLQSLGVSLGQSLQPGHEPNRTRAGALVLTKLEEACFYAKKDMASSPENSQP